MTLVRILSCQNKKNHFGKKTPISLSMSMPDMKNWKRKNKFLTSKFEDCRRNWIRFKLRKTAVEIVSKFLRCGFVHIQECEQSLKMQRHILSIKTQYLKNGIQKIQAPEQKEIALDVKGLLSHPAQEYFTNKISSNLVLMALYLSMSQIEILSPEEIYSENSQTTLGMVVRLIRNDPFQSDQHLSDIGLNMDGSYFACFDAPLQTPIIMLFEQSCQHWDLIPDNYVMSDEYFNLLECYEGNLKKLFKVVKPRNYQKTRMVLLFEQLFREQTELPPIQSCCSMFENTTFKIEPNQMENSKPEKMIKPLIRSNKGLVDAYETPSKQQIKQLYNASKLRGRFCTSPLMLVLSLFFFVLIILISFLVRKQRSEYWDVAAISDALYYSEGPSLPTLEEVNSPQLFYAYTLNKYKNLIKDSNSTGFKIFRIGIHQIRYDRTACPRGCSECCLTYRDYQGDIFIDASQTSFSDYNLSYSSSIDSLSYTIRGAFHSYHSSGFYEQVPSPRYASLPDFESLVTHYSNSRYLKTYTRSILISMLSASSSSEYLALSVLPFETDGFGSFVHGPTQVKVFEPHIFHNSLHTVINSCYGGMLCLCILYSLLSFVFLILSLVMKCKRGDYKSKTTLLLSTSLMLLLHCGVIIYCSYMLSYFLKLQTPMEYIDSNIEAFDPWYLAQSYKIVILSTASFSIVLGALLLQFTIVSPFASLYVQMIKATFLLILGFYVILMAIMFGFSFMASSLLQQSQFQDQLSAYLFTLQSFAHQRPYLSIDKNRGVFSFSGGLFIALIYFVEFMVFNFLPSAYVIEKHRQMQMTREEMKMRKGAQRKRKFKEWLCQCGYRK